MIVERIILILFLVDFWISEVYDIKVIRILRFRLNYKPFSCGYCLTFWLSLFVFLITFNPLIFATPLIYKLIKNNL